MKSAVYSILAALVVIHCTVAQYSMYLFTEEVRINSIVPMGDAVQNLASSNVILNQRIERARVTVEVVTAENTRLKASLNEGVEMLKDEIAENNRLNHEIEILQVKVNTLQNIVDRLPKESTDEPVRPC